MLAQMAEIKIDADDAPGPADQFVLERLKILA
jgi:hypothetical protein